MRTRTRTILAGLVLAAALVGGVAWATIPDAAGVINGCYRTSLDDQKGQLRVVDDPASCRSNETAISWNEKGVPGATGAAGPAGPQGAKGDKGSDGAAGLQGAKGDTGAAGPAGADGAPGTNGTNGTNGTDGQPGTNGTNGVDGVNGAPGAQGAQGPQGVPGASGGVSGREIVFNSVTAPAHLQSFVAAICPAGKMPIGGGFGTSSDFSVSGSYPSGNSWYANGVNDSDHERVLRVYAVCANSAS